MHGTAIRKCNRFAGGLDRANWPDAKPLSTKIPRGQKAQALAGRWQAQIEEASGGDLEIKLGLLAGWSRRRESPASLCWQVEHYT